MDVQSRKPDIRAVQLIIVNVVLLLVLIFYYPFVYLPFVFDFSNLPVANIPYYRDDQSWPWTWAYMSTRYGVFWWVLSLDFGYLVLLMIPFVVLYLQERKENTYLRAVLKEEGAITGKRPEYKGFWNKNTVFRWALLLFTGVGLVVEFARNLYFILGGLTCSQVQQCRLDTLQKGQNSIFPNGNWWWLSVSHIVLWVLMLAYFSIFLAIPEQESLEVDKKKK